MVCVLNWKWDRERTRLALIAVARHILDDEVSNYWFGQQRLLHHISRAWDSVVEGKVPNRDLEWGEMQETEEMFNWALQGFEKTLGPEHSLALNGISNLRHLYAKLGRVGDMITFASKGKPAALPFWGF